MGRFKRTLGPAVPIAGALALWVVAVATVPAETAPAVATVTTGAPAPAQASGYVGEDTCLTCHEDQAYKGTAHARAGNPDTPAATTGCESCHGPGQLHVEGGGDKTQIKTFNAGGLTPSEAGEICATCHNRGDHAFWAGSQHDRRDVTCTTCHSVHDPKSLTGQLKKETQQQVCATCHRDKVAKLDRSGHMPVREGKIDCSTCHNIHGSTNVRLLRTGNSVAESCQTCHQEKRGPYLWEHAPVRENCATCHDPHGSSNERMLVAKQPMLCQRCHAHTRHPPTVYDNRVLESSNRVFGRSCVNCHSNVHGSNHPSGWSFLR